jgi:AraC family ethanolamine operon transcriptional activator
MFIKTSPHAVPIWYGETAIPDDSRLIESTSSPNRCAPFSHNTRNEITLVAPEQGEWRQSSRDLGCAIIEVGRDGGANIRRGTTPIDCVQLRIQTPMLSTQCKLDGCVIGAQDIVLLPPGKNFTMTASGPCAWMAMIFPVGVFAEIGLDPLQSFQNGAVIVEAPGNLLRQIALVNTAVLDSSSGDRIRRTADASSLVISILTGIATCDGVFTSGKRGARSESQRRLERALVFLEKHEDRLVSVDELCRAANIGERTLLRLFHDFLGMGPGRFMKLRQLNRVWRTIKNERGPHGTLTNLLADYNVTEFGRFAGTYKALFGESPSVTRRKQIAADKSLVSFHLGKSAARGTKSPRRDRHVSLHA